MIETKYGIELTVSCNCPDKEAILLFEVLDFPDPDILLTIYRKFRLRKKRYIEEIVLNKDDLLRIRDFIDKAIEIINKER